MSQPPPTTVLLLGPDPEGGAEQRILYAVGVLTSLVADAQLQSRAVSIAVRVGAEALCVVFLDPFMLRERAVFLSTRGQIPAPPDITRRYLRAMFVHAAATPTAFIFENDTPTTKALSDDEHKAFLRVCRQIAGRIAGIVAPGAQAPAPAPHPSGTCRICGKAGASPESPVCEAHGFLRPYL